MPSSARPKGSGASGRIPPVTPMSERQQMALLMQMTSTGNEAGSRSPSGASSSRSRERNERGETPLHIAAIKGDHELVGKLLNQNADPNVADFAGWTPLHEACNHGWYDVAVKLVKAGANVNAKGLDNETPLHDAAINGHYKLVKLLVEHGADIYAKNSKGKTPLDTALPSVAALLLNPNSPIPETTPTTRVQPRSRDEKKSNESGKQKSSSDESMETSKNASEDVYEFKSVKESDSSPDQKSSDALEGDGDTADPLSLPNNQNEEGAKRTFNEMQDASEDNANDEESRRKKRKEESAKDAKGGAPQRNTGQGKGQANKQGSSSQNKTGTQGASKTGNTDKKSPVASPKPANTSDAEVEDGKSDLKVPPLKIVIPQSTSNEQESGPSRNGKSSSQRSHQALPYVVPSSNNESSEKEGNSGSTSPTDQSSLKIDEKKENSSGSATEDQRGSGHHQRVLRSSHRSGQQGSADRNSNSSSPQLHRSHSPSPPASPSNESNQYENNNGTNLGTTPKSSENQASTNNDSDNAASTASTSNAPAPAPASVELHPRKRKMKQTKESAPAQPSHDPPEVPALSEVHPHDQPITNCYQLFLNIRKQIEKRRKGLFPVQPKPPQGFKDYLMNRCAYVLTCSSPTTPNITYPVNLPPQMKDLFTEQEKERYKLRMQHIIEKEKLVLSVEQEILRVHGRAARALANQSLPFSVCTILRDEEVYNLITPEQEEKDRNARSRYNGRLFLSWLQDVDDKWEKIKEAMLLRHHNEAESLYAVQKMNWEWKMKEMSLCDHKSTPTIDEMHVSMVHVSDDFDLLPA